MKDIKNLKIAYIGGGSRGWARNVMNDLYREEQLSGEVRLYDIDLEAAQKNAIIGNRISTMPECKGKWLYRATDDIKTALTGADFVFISILPGTFDEMASDVHAPEKYGIWQSVGDSTGPGGIVRAMRTIPMFEYFARSIAAYCPDAWIINFTNPMTMCVRTLYKVFPEIKAFGCCHEVFGTQTILGKVIEEELGRKAARDEIRINVLGVNHFTWLTEAKYMGTDLFPLYDKYVDRHRREGIENISKGHWINGAFASQELVKFDLFKRCGAIAAAGDRHLAEFCPGNWYLASPEKVHEFGFTLTPVSHRIEERKRLIADTDEIVRTGNFPFYATGEETVRQLKALLGLGDFVTNVNIPNAGQMEGIPLGAVVETNAFFSGNSVRPLMAGGLPNAAAVLVHRIVLEQETVVDAVLRGDYEAVFGAFANDPNVCLPLDKARALFDEMLENTKAYLPHYDAYKRNRT